jgi:hypothetical protein
MPLQIQTNITTLKQIIIIMKPKASLLNFLVCMAILLISNLVFYVNILEAAKQKYIIDYKVPDIYHPESEWIGPFGGHHYQAAYNTKPELSYQQIGNSFYVVMFLTALFFIVYPVVGRILVYFSQILTAIFDKLSVIVLCH